MLAITGTTWGYIALGVGGGGGMLWAIAHWFPGIGSAIIEGIGGAIEGLGDCFGEIGDSLSDFGDGFGDD